MNEREEKISYQLPKSFKCCLTCTYWCGMRRLVMQERYAETETASTKGMCVNNKGFYHIDTTAQTSCSGHESLPALKD